MNRRKLLQLTPAFLPSAKSHAATEITNFRFGILRATPTGGYEIARETRRIPRLLKHTGFRFGLGFDNPRCLPIEWYEIVRLPEDLKELSGNFQRTSRRNIRTMTFQSDQPRVVDHFWFDEGDPLGRHMLELHVDGALRYSVEFEVVAAR